MLGFWGLLSCRRLDKKKISLMMISKILQKKLRNYFPNESGCMVARG
jgi:hypothetical protein